MKEKTLVGCLMFTAALLSSLLTVGEARAQVTNLIANPSLETVGSDGNPTSWIQDYWGNTVPVFSYPVPGRGGADKAALVTLNADTDGDAHWSHLSVTVLPGQTYTFSGWYKSDVESQIDTESTNGSGSPSYGWLLDLPSSGNVWKQATATVVIPSGITKMTVYQLIAKKGTLTIDDFSLTLGTTTVITPPPATTTPPASPTLTFTGTPSKINFGQSATLTWSAQNVSSCTGTGGWTGSQLLSGSHTVSPTATTTYGLSCVGAGGAVVKQVIIAIVVPPLPPLTPGSFAEGMVSLTFDDSWASQYTKALPILDAAGFKGTFYITSQPIKEKWDGFMTVAQLKSLASKGHEVAGHTVTHPHLPNLNATKLNQELKNSKTYIETQIGMPISALAYPYGEYNANVKTRTKAAGYTSGRSTEADSLNLTTTDRYALKSPCPVLSTPLSEIKSWIDQAKSKKQWFILCLHEVDTNGAEYSMTPGRLQEIINYIKSSGVKVVTVNEGVALMK